MTEFSCSVCGYSSLIKQHLDNHLNRKKSCGSGVKKIIEIPVKIKCEFCDKLFSSLISLRYHIKNNCKLRDAAKDIKIKELEEQLKQAKQVTNNITNNFIIVVNNYEDTSLDKLTDKIYNKLLKDSESAYQIIPSLIKQIHFDPNTPENHNIVLNNRTKNNKHLQIFRNGHWEITDKNTEIDNIINDKETDLSDWVTEKGQKYPEAMEKFSEYLDQKYDEDVAKLMKDEVEMLLYNNRHMVKPI
jgi:hypothetical protein